MAQRTSLRPGHVGIVAGLIAAFGSMFRRGQPVIAQPSRLQHATGVGPSVNWLKGSLISGKTAPGARGG